jgi:hypothetical protein
MFDILGSNLPIATQLVISGSRGVYTGGYGMTDTHRCERIETSRRVAGCNPSITSSIFEMLRPTRTKCDGALPSGGSDTSSRVRRRIQAPRPGIRIYQLARSEDVGIGEKRHA